MTDSLIARGGRRCVIIVSHLLAPLFFKKRHLKGRHFGRWGQGWLWAWRSIWTQRILGVNRAAGWPVGPMLRISNPDNIEFDQDDLHNFQTFGCYFQNPRAKIVLGKGTYIAPNVGLITQNHDPQDLDHHLDGAPIVIGPGSWIGMNAVILPGVTLGPKTIVGAGAVVTSSFPEGYCIVAGVPAKLIRKLERSEREDGAANVAVQAAP